MIPRGVPAPAGLSLRPPRPADRGFLESLSLSAAAELTITDMEDDFVEESIDEPSRAAAPDAGEVFPNATPLIVEYHGERIGRVVLDCRPHEVQVLDIALTADARGRDLGGLVLQGVQAASAKAMMPVVLVLRYDDLPAQRRCLQLGFRVEEVQFPFERMAWYPPVAGH